MLDKTSAEQIAAAARSLLDREGADAVTMRRVASAVGLTAMAVYRHYPDRAGLLNKLANEGFEELASRLKGARVSGDIEKRVIKVLDIFLKHALDNPHLFELMFLKPRQGSRRYPRDFKAGRSPTANLLVQLIEEGMETGQFRKDDVWEVVFQMGALMQGLVMLYVGGRMEMSPARFRGFCHRSVFRYMRGIRS
jgi:AcrR family transcriptional regulator